MDAEAVRRTMTGYLDALASEGDFARYLADDVVMSVLETGDVVRGREAVRDFVLGMHVATLAARFVCTKLVCDSDAAAIEAQLIGSHVGPFAGVPPTGAPVTIAYSVVYDLADDLITEVRAYVPITATAQLLQATASNQTANA